MAQTELSWASLAAALPDNTVGAVSPRDLRDAIASALGGYGNILLSRVGATVDMLSVGTTPENVDVYDTITTQSSATFTNGVVCSLTSNDITVGAAWDAYEISFSANVSLAVGSKVITFTPYIDGTAGLVMSPRTVTAGGDIGSIHFTWQQALTVGQVIEMRVNLDSGTTNLTFHNASLAVKRA